MCLLCDYNMYKKMMFFGAVSPQTFGKSEKMFIEKKNHQKILRIFLLPAQPPRCAAAIVVVVDAAVAVERRLVARNQEDISAERNANQLRGSFA